MAIPQTWNSILELRIKVQGLSFFNGYSPNLKLNPWTLILNSWNFGDLGMEFQVKTVN